MLAGCIFTAKAWRGTTNKLRRGIRRRQTKGILMRKTILGVMYDEGFGVAQDAKQAAMWYQKAANRGHVEAQFSLGGDVSQWARRGAR